MTGEQTKVHVSLSHEEALVLFEWLSSLEESASVPPAGSAERTVLWKIGAQLESSLHEIFATDYTDQLTRARDIISGK